MYRIIFWGMRYSEVRQCKLGCTETIYKISLEETTLYTLEQLKHFEYEGVDYEYHPYLTQSSQTLIAKNTTVVPMMLLGISNGYSKVG